ncbi:hypothetical protein [Allokutzneria oryzae]|uniref:Secreted protein n=1 Tax=Allokutzneria oryzae TaxID=1378989 RepID=A0ABV5ZPM1_9PSEU
MKRRVGYLGLWLVATALSVVMAWLGLRSVLVAAAPGRLDLLDQLNASSGSAGHGQRGGSATDDVALGPATSVPGHSGALGGPPGPTGSRDIPGIPIQPPGPNPGDPVVTTAPPSTRPSQNGGGTPSSSNRPTGSNTTTTTSAAADPSLLGKPTEGQTRTIRTKGGDSTLRFAESDVSVVSAKPVSGHSVKVEQVSATSVVVTFASPTSVSRIQANWVEGPAWRITEIQT